MGLPSIHLFMLFEEATTVQEAKETKYALRMRKQIRKNKKTTITLKIATVN